MTSTEKLEAFLAEPRNVVVAGIRRDGSPHLSPNWFYWDGERFYVSITRSRVKYKIFTRDPRVELLIDDSTAFRAVLVPALMELLGKANWWLPSWLVKVSTKSAAAGRPAPLKTGTHA